jgi:hypothetical protein
MRDRNLTQFAHGALDQKNDPMTIMRLPEQHPRIAAVLFVPPTKSWRTTDP